MLDSVTRAKQLKGVELTREEVFRIRDQCVVLVSTPEAAQAIEKRRGYTDLDFSDPWSSWLELHDQMK
jgi:hypothetical protein